MAQWIHIAKRATSCAVTTAALVLSIQGVASQPAIAAPSNTSVDFAFDLQARSGESASVQFKVTTPGCIQAQIRPWTSSTQDTPKAIRLQLALKGSDRTFPYVSVVGSSSANVPLWISYAAFPSDVNRVSEWTVVVNTLNSRGTARGVVRVDYPPGQLPCALRATTELVNNRNSVNLSWLYTSGRFMGSFLIERSSNNGAAWRTVGDCVVPVSNRTVYTCADTNVDSGDYLYRACAVTTDVACSASNVTPAIRVNVK